MGRNHYGKQPTEDLDWHIPGSNLGKDGDKPDQKDEGKPDNQPTPPVDRKVLLFSSTPELT